MSNNTGMYQSLSKDLPNLILYLNKLRMKIDAMIIAERINKNSAEGL
jgi:hypothetical protein